MAINKDHLLIEVQKLLSMLKKGNPAHESVEWYLINKLKKYYLDINAAVSVEQIKGASEELDMFCIDSMNWDTSLFKKCSKVVNLGLELAKNN